MRHNGFGGACAIHYSEGRTTLSLFFCKGLIFLIAISKEEKDIVSSKYPKVHIVRTMRQRSSRHRYYMEEQRDAMGLVRRMRAAKGEK